MKLFNELPQASTPVASTDEILISRNGITVNRTAISNLPLPLTINQSTRADIAGVVVATNSGDFSLPNGSLLTKKYIDFSNYLPDNPASTNCSSALSQAISDAMALSIPLYIPKGEYLISSAVKVNNAQGLEIIGEGSRKTIFRTNSTDYILELSGGAYDTTPINLTADVNAGDIIVSVSDTSRFSVNSWVNIQSNRIWDSTSTKNARFGELVKVKSIITNTSVTFYTPLDYGYLISDIARLNACPLGDGIKISGIGCINNNPLTDSNGAIVLRQFENIEIDDIYGELLDGPLLTYVGCVNGKINRVDAKYLADDENNERYGYVHNLSDSTKNLVITNGYSFACRHHITTNAGATSVIGGVPSHIEVVGCIAEAHTNVAFDTHEEGDDITFTACKAIGNMDVGFGMRAPRSTLVNPVVRGGKGTGIVIRATSVGSSIWNADISNLTGIQSTRNNPTVGIDIWCAETLVDGFNIVNTGQGAIRILGANRCQIRNGRINGFGSSGTNIFGIHFSGPSIDHEIQDVRIDGAGRSNSFGMSAGTGGSAVTGVKITNVTSRRCSGSQLNISNLTSQSVQGTAITETVLNSTLV